MTSSRTAAFKPLSDKAQQELSPDYQVYHKRMQSQSGNMVEAVGLAKSTASVLVQDIQVAGVPCRAYTPRLHPAARIVLLWIPGGTRSTSVEFCCLTDTERGVLLESSRCRLLLEFVTRSHCPRHQPRYRISKKLLYAGG